MPSVETSITQPLYWNTALNVPDPVLWMDFTRGLPVRPALTVTGSGGTVRNGQGLIQAAVTNTARLDHDSSGVPIGLLVEEARTQRVTEPRDMTNAAWNTATNITPLKDATGITGVANSASTLTATAGLGVIRQAITLGSAARTYSAWVRRKTGTGTIEITDNGGSNYTDITSSINSVTYTKVEVTRTQANPDVGFRITTSGDEIEVDVNQVEEGAGSTSPILAAGTRTADVATMVASDFSYNDAASTFVIDYSYEGLSGSQYAFEISDNSNANRIAVFATDGKARYFIFNDSVDQASHQEASASWTAGTARKVALAYTTNDAAFAVAGATLDTDAAVSLANHTMTEFSIGASHDPAAYLNGHIKLIGYWVDNLETSPAQFLTELSKAG